MLPANWLIFLLGGLFSGILAGLLGIGGGTILVPILVALGKEPVQAVATSLFTIVITSLSGSIQNWRMGYLSFSKVLAIALPSLITAQIGVFLANNVPKSWLLASFGLLLIATIFLTNLRQQLAVKSELSESENLGNNGNNKIIACLTIGSSGGLLAGFFGIGGGVIMVPLQLWLLQENIKTAIQTSLGVIVITSISACLGHALSGNVLFQEGLLLGIGGLIGAQISTRFLPELPDKVVAFLFRLLLSLLAIYFLWKAANS